MGSLKPWQLVLVIIAVLVLAVSLWMVLSNDKVYKPNQVMLVDITTGDRFIVKTSGKGTTILPAWHPETGDRTLFPIVENEDGEWVVSEMLRSNLLDYAGDRSAVLDLERFVVRLSDASPKPLK